jgi:hypothetical protein
MQSETTHKNVGLIMFVFACALMLVAGMSAHGQWRDRDWGRDRDDNYRNGRIYRNDDRWGRVSQREIRKSYERGYKQGLKEGKRDARDNRGGYYGNGRYGGNRGYGTYGGNGRYNGGYYGGGQIQRAYQEGFQRGYQEGYDRNRRYNRNDRYGRNRSIFGIPLPY